MHLKVFICFLSLFLSIGFAMESADETFTKAAHLAETNLGQARQMYRVAALRYLDEAKSDPLHQGPLLYNAGNAFFLAGEAGHAVVAYRRAEKWIPASTLLRDNLAFVRKQGGNIESEMIDSTPPLAFYFWIKNPAVLWLALFLVTLLFWTDLFLKQWRGKNRGIPRFPLRVILCLIALLSFILIRMELQNSNSPRGVIIAPQTVARKGPNDGYAPAFTAPLDPGLECEIINAQDDWLQIRLDSSHTAWIRQSTVEKIP